jgi:hypothetical protein
VNVDVATDKVMLASGARLMSREPRRHSGSPRFASIARAVSEAASASAEAGSARALAAVGLVIAVDDLRLSLQESSTYFGWAGGSGARSALSRARAKLQDPALSTIRRSALDSLTSRPEKQAS